MRVALIQHVAFEDAGAIADWAAARGHEMTTVMAMADAFPGPEEHDLLVILGGPMGARDEAIHPWLAAEKRAIRAAVDGGGRVLGVCLGAQILADVLGAEVTRNPEPEIGWYLIELAPEAAVSRVFGAVPADLIVGHWHGDTFGVPDGAVRMASSVACANQAFEYDGGRVVGVQFHLEWTAESVEALVATCGDELIPAPHVVMATEFAEGERVYGRECRGSLFALLDGMAGIR